MSSWIWLFLLSLTTIYVSIQATTLDPAIVRQVLPAYAVLENDHLLNSSKCRTEIQEFRDAVDNGILWGLKALDTSAVPPEGFINGNNYWLGDFLGCTILSVNRTQFISEEKRKNDEIYRNPDEEYPPFEFRFFIARMRHNSTVQYHIEIEDEDLITLGLCLPASCSKRDVATMLEKVLHNETLLIGKLFAIHFRLIQVSDLANDHQWLLSVKIVCILAVLLALCATVVAATIYDVFVHRKRSKNEKGFLKSENNSTYELKNEIGDKYETVEDPVFPKLKQQNRISQYLLCFSLPANVEQIFKSEKGADGFRILHGMRILGTTCIILYHTVTYSVHATGNKTQVMIKNDLLMNIVMNLTFPVDTFFFIGGFLLSYTFLNGRRKEKGIPPIAKRINEFIQKIVKRYVRLTPAYLVVILIAMLIFDWHDRFSILLPIEHPSVKCSKYWWTNILYINNFYKWDDLCLTWCWYLPNDMQFFVFGSFLLTLSITHYNIAVGIGIVTLLSSIGSLAYTGYALNFQPTVDGQYRTLTDIYIRPWCRIPPYLIGMATCHLLAKWNYKLHLSKRSLIIGWTLASLCSCSILLGFANKNISLGLSVFYVALSRTGWALSIAWLVVACTTNNGGIVNKILSLDVFARSSKLSYIIYLVHPVLVISLYSLRKYHFIADEISLSAMFLAIAVFSFVVSIPLTATTEIPFISLLRLYNRLKKTTK